MQTWIKKVFGFGIASFFADVSHEMTVSFIPILVAQFVPPPSVPFFLGVIASLSDAFASFLRLFSGYISDITMHKKPLIAFGYGIAALFSTLTGFAHSLWSIFLYRILSFTGSGLREPPRDALIAATVGSEYYGRAFGLRNAMDTMGALLGPLIAWAVADICTVPSIFLLSAIPGFLAVASIIFLTQDIQVPVKELKPGVSLWNSIKLLPKNFLIFLAILFIFDLSFFNKLLLLARAQEVLPYSGAYIAQAMVLLYTIFNLSRAVCEFIIGRVSDYLDRILLLAIFGCGFLACTALLLMVSTASFGYYILIFVLAGISTGAITTLKKACAADMVPQEAIGLGYGVLQATEGFAALFSSFITGLLWTHYSATYAFSYVTILSLFSMLLLLIIIYPKSK